MPRGNPAAKHNIRVAPDSALERLVAGKSFTEAVHRMAEVFEQALAEDWGPRLQTYGLDDYTDRARRPPQVVEIYEPTEEDVLMSLALKAKQGAELALRVGVDPGAPGGDQSATMYEITEPDGKKHWVSEQELLTIMGDQMPSALQPVAVVQNDKVEAPLAEAETEDYSHII